VPAKFSYMQIWQTNLNYSSRPCVWCCGYSWTWHTVLYICHEHPSQLRPTQHWRKPVRASDTTRGCYLPSRYISGMLQQSWWRTWVSSHENVHQYLKIWIKILCFMTIQFHIYILVNTTRFQKNVTFGSWDQIILTSGNYERKFDSSWVNGYNKQCNCSMNSASAAAV